MSTENPYGDAALDYLEAGWRGPLPIPYRQKFPPPTNANKKTSAEPTTEQIEEWRTIGPRNICVRCTDVDDDHEIIGIDVDHYSKGLQEKTGFDQLAELEEKYGPLPATWIATARTDRKSGIRFYRVPKGLYFRPEADENIDIIRKGHRYAMVWPSVHPEQGTYWWYPPGVEPAPETRSAWNATLPDATNLPVLPNKWIDFLTDHRKVRGSEDQESDDDSTVDEIHGWARETFYGDEHTEPCQFMRKKLSYALKKLQNATSLHKPLIDAHWNLLDIAYEGHFGWKLAIDEYEKMWAYKAAEGGGTTDRNYAALRGEIFRSRIGALRKIKYKSNKNTEINARPILASCEDTEQCANSSGYTLSSSFIRMLDHSQPATVCLADVEPKSIEWLWKGLLPLGKLSLFEGESDVGKSTLTLNWASIVSNGSRWPETVTVDGHVMISQHEPAGVVLVGIEDSNADTVVPRLIAAGANLNKVHSLTRPVDSSGKLKPFTIPEDIAWLRRAITSVDAKLVIIDPITACLPEDTKHGVDSSVRRILMSLVDLAEETNAAIVIIRHFNKSAGMSAKNRGGGSVAYTALCRSVLQATELISPTDEGATHAISQAVGNLSKKLKARTYKLADALDMKGLPPPSDDGLRVAVAKYCGTIDLTADQLVGADGAKVSDARKTAPMRDDAEEALREILADEKPQEMKSVIAQVINITGCKEGTVKNAAKNIGIKKKSVYQPGKKGVSHWTWQLPPTVLPFPRTGIGGIGGTAS